MNYGYIWLKINWKHFSFITKTHRSVGLGTSVATGCVDVTGKFDRKLVFYMACRTHESFKCQITCLQ